MLIGKAELINGKAYKFYQIRSPVMLKLYIFGGPLV